MGNAVAFMAILGSTLGALGGMVGLLQFLNTRNQVRRKGDADIASVWNDLTQGALDRAYKDIKDIQTREEALVDLVQDLIGELISPNKKEIYQDKLDSIRRM